MWFGIITLFPEMFSNLELGITGRALKEGLINVSCWNPRDFTKNKHGVYFEAGYALGRGQKVIYTCREDSIEDAHFDIRNYQHLVWKDGEDLKMKLMDKIEVFIKV